MDIHEFKAKWQRSTLKEGAASHEHLLDLRRALNKPTPAEFDSDGAFYTFDRAVWTTCAWPEDPTDTDEETILRRLLALNLERAGAELRGYQARIGGSATTTGAHIATF